MVKRLTVPEKTLLAITNGSSLDAVKNKLGIAARHEFTVAETNGNYTLITCYFSGGDNALWLLFRDKILIKVIAPFSFPELVETYPYQGTTASRTKSWDIDGPVIAGINAKVIDAPALTHDEILNALKPYNGAGMEPLNILPAFLLTGSADKWASRIEKDYEINEELSKRYDGCQANLGMSAEDIEKLYGKPLRVFVTKNGETARIYGYGENRELQVNPQLVFTGMAVVTDAKGHVTAIYSHEFFNDEWKK
jgi:hypothetical protein